MGKHESKLSFLRTSQHLAIFEPQIYVVSEQFEAENISLLSGRLVSFIIFVTSSASVERTIMLFSVLCMLSKWITCECLADKICKLKNSMNRTYRTIHNYKIHLQFSWHCLLQ